MKYSVQCVLIGMFFTAFFSCDELPGGLPSEMAAEDYIPVIATDLNTLSVSTNRGTNAQSDSFSVWNTGTGLLNFSVISDVSWLVCTPVSGTSQNYTDKKKIRVDYNTTGLSANNLPYIGNIIFRGVIAEPETVTVSLTINEAQLPVLGVSKNTISTSCDFGTTCPSDSFLVWNDGPGVLDFIVTTQTNWIVCSPASGSSQSSTDKKKITVNFQTSALPARVAPYEDTITISGTGGIVKKIPLSATVISSTEPELHISRDTLSTGALSGSNAVSETFRISNSGSGELEYIIEEAIGWLSINVDSGSVTTGEDTITVTYQTASLPVNSYGGSIIISSEADEDTIIVRLEITDVEKPVISVDPSFFDFTFQQGSTPPASFFFLSNSGTGALDYSISIDSILGSLSMSSGTITTGDDSVAINWETTDLQEGTYKGNITVSAPDLLSKVIPVTLRVTERINPVLEMSVTGLTPGTVEGEDANNEIVEIWNSGNGTLQYTLTTDASWILVTPNQGTSLGEKDEILVFYPSSGQLNVGSHTGTITVADNEGNEQNIAVTLTVSELAQPIIGLTKSTISLSAISGSTPEPTSAFSVYNSGSGELHYSVSDSVAWLVCDVSGGAVTTGRDTVTFRAHTSIVPGDYVVDIKITNLDNDSVKTVRVTYEVLENISPEIVVSVDTLVLPSLEAGSYANSPSSFLVNNKASTSLTIDISENTGWLSTSPNSLVSTGPNNQQTVTVDYTAKDLAPNTYYGEILLTGTYVDTTRVVVELKVTAQIPELALNPLSLQQTVKEGENGSADNFTVWNKTGGTLTFTTVARQGHVSVPPESMSSTGPNDIQNVTVEYNISSLPAGTYRDTIEVRSSVDTQFVIANIDISESELVPPIDAGTRLAFTFGYNDMDGDGDSVNSLRWKNIDPISGGGDLFGNIAAWADLITGSDFPNGIAGSDNIDVNDALLFINKLTSAETNQISFSDGDPASFWNTNWNGKDYVSLTTALHSYPNRDSWTGADDAGLLLKAGANGNGIYFYFEILDNVFVDPIGGSESWKFDAIDIYIDNKSSGTIANEGSAIMVNPSYYQALTFTSMQFQIFLYGTNQPEWFSLSYYDNLFFTWAPNTISFSESANLYDGMQMEVFTIDNTTKGVELFIPWSWVGNGGVQ